jgi:hypothetical protein
MKNKILILAILLAIAFSVTHISNRKLKNRIDINKRVRLY